MGDEEAPVGSEQKEGLLEKVLKLALRVAVVFVSVALMLLLWTIWKIFPPSLDIATVLVASGIFAAALIVWVPKLQTFRISFTSSAERFGAENEARKTVATLVAGVAIFLSFYTAQQQLGVQQQVQFTERYTKAIDQIAASDGGDKPIG